VCPFCVGLPERGGGGKKKSMSDGERDKIKDWEKKRRG